MNEEIRIPKDGTKAEIYQAILPQIEALVEKETNRTASLANITAILKSACSFFWTGFYIVKDDSLVLGPFQGDLACTRIEYGKGVCGTAWAHKETIVVEDVNKFDGHIACSSLSQSEIVIPVVKNGKVIAVLDIDSEQLSHFDATDAAYLEKVCELTARYCF